MTMKTVVDKLKALYAAATTAYLATAVVRIGDVPETQRTDSVVTICVIPLPSEDVPFALGEWHDMYRVNIRARYPRQWDDGESDKALDLSIEMLQVIRDNWQWLSGDSEQAVLKRRQWGYGYDASGEQQLGAIDMVVEYQGPGLAAT